MGRKREEIRPILVMWFDVLGLILGSNVMCMEKFWGIDGLRRWLRQIGCEGE